MLNPYAYSDLNAAEAKFHSILASAAISSLSCHTCMLYTNTGDIIRSEKYMHEVTSDDDDE